MRSSKPKSTLRRTASKRTRRFAAAFFARELAAEGSYVRAWIAYAGERAAGSAVLTMAPSLPRPGRAASLDGRVRSVYVIPELRRCGIGAALTRAAIEGAEAAGIDRLTLGASVAGAPLYASLGFRPKPSEMVYEGGAQP